MTYRIVPTLVLVLSVAGVAIAQEDVRTEQQDREAIQVQQQERDAAIQAEQPDRDTATRTQEERTAFRAQIGGAQTGELDGHIAACLILGNQQEVALSQMAVQRAQNEQVRQFAQRMVQDHQQAMSQLQQFAPQGVSLEIQQGEQRTQIQQRQTGAAQRQEGQVRTQTEIQTRTGTDQQQAQPREQLQAQRQEQQRQQQAGVRQQEGVARRQQQAATVPQDELVELEKQVVQNAIELTQRELAEKDGAEFDKAFMSKQVGAHLHMLAKLTASEQFASSELGRVVQKQQQTVQQHLQHAKQIQQQLEGQTRAAQPRETAPRR